MKQSSLVEDLQAVYTIIKFDPSRAAEILSRIIYELEHEEVESDD